MIIQTAFEGKTYRADLGAGFDLSIPLRGGKENVNAFNLPPPRYEVFRSGNFSGSVGEGGSCNCEIISISPHGNGTHTECVGHISPGRITINQCLSRFFFWAELLSVEPLLEPGGDRIVTRDQVVSLRRFNAARALLLRTLPNGDEKLQMHYSGKNPPYTDPGLCQWLALEGIEHFLLDLPSVDREDDGGKLLSHRAFWNYPAGPRLHATLTEMIFVPSYISDGLYLLNLQTGPFESDAGPSRPVIYPVEELS